MDLYWITLSKATLLLVLSYVRDQGFKDFSAIPLCSEKGKVFKRIRLNEDAYSLVLSVKLGHFPPTHNLSSSLFPEQLFNFSAFYTESQGSFQG